MFSIVEFDDDDGVAIVNTAWLTPRKRETYWPPTKDREKFYKILTCDQSNTSSWNLYKIKRVFYYTDDIEVAKRKLKKVEVTSDLHTESDDEVKAPRKRARTKPSRLIEEDCGSAESDHQDDTSTNDERPPRNNWQFSKQISNGQENGFIRQNECPSTPQITPSSRTNVRFSTPTVENSQGDLKECSCLPHVLKIYEQNKKNLKLLEQQHHPLADVTFGDEFHFPLHTVEDVEQMENLISSDIDLQRRLVMQLSKLGGNGVVSITNKILKTLMEDSLASEFNFFGKNKKKAFGNLKLKEIVVNAVQTQSKNSTIAEIENCMKNWLKHGPQRAARATNPK
uniref:DUF4806 domain-containing protein n=1 Tax=Photinus pyralis TaxID=7054 RepID=A0A1Y1LWW9_PHOPY